MLIEQVRSYVNELEKVCPVMTQDDKRFAVLGDSDGDACLFNGLLASVWDNDPAWPLYAVLDSQASTGLWYRSPRRRAVDNAGFSSIFSRDMALGVLLSMASHNDLKIEMQAKMWLDYIGSRAYNPCLVKAFGKCLIKSPKTLYEYAPGDDRTTITPEMWATMQRVWKHNNWDFENAEMKLWAGMDGDIAVIEAEQTKLGYTLHLKAVQAFLKLLVGQSREYSMKVGQVAYERLPSNLFYRFLATRVIDDKFIQDYLDCSPPVQSRWGNVWLWQVARPENEWIDSCGWDFVFLGRLILKYWRNEEW